MRRPGSLSQNSVQGTEPVNGSPEGGSCSGDTTESYVKEPVKERCTLVFMIAHGGLQCRPSHHPARVDGFRVAK
jgi:hypothetical protein